MRQRDRFIFSNLSDRKINLTPFPTQEGEEGARLVVYRSPVRRMLPVGPLARLPVRADDASVEAPLCWRPLSSISRSPASTSSTKGGCSTALALTWPVLLGPRKSFLPPGSGTLIGRFVLLMMSIYFRVSSRWVRHRSSDLPSPTGIPPARSASEVIRSA